MLIYLLIMSEQTVWCPKNLEGHLKLGQMQVNHKCTALFNFTVVLLFFGIILERASAAVM